MLMAPSPLMPTLTWQTLIVTLNDAPQPLPKSRALMLSSTTVDYTAKGVADAIANLAAADGTNLR